jgi:hypothetical protein
MNLLQGYTVTFLSEVVFSQRRLWSLRGPRRKSQIRLVDVRRKLRNMFTCYDRVFRVLVWGLEGVYCGTARGPWSSVALGGRLVRLAVEPPLLSRSCSSYCTTSIHHITSHQRKNVICVSVSSCFNPEIYYYINKDTKIKLFNVYVKSVLLCGCQTWLVTRGIQRKL